MSEENETSTQTFDSSSETNELTSSPETERQPAFGETPDTELTLRSVNNKIQQSTDPTLKRVEQVCALLASRTEMESAGVVAFFWARVLRYLAVEEARFRMRIILGVVLIRSLACTQWVPRGLRSSSGVALQ